MHDCNSLSMIRHFFTISDKYRPHIHTGHIDIHTHRHIDKHDTLTQWTDTQRRTHWTHRHTDTLTLWTDTQTNTLDTSTYRHPDTLDRHTDRHPGHTDTLDTQTYIHTGHTEIHYYKC